MRYTYVKQQDATDCAAACLAMVCLHYKKETTITRLRDLMGTDLKGTNLVGLSKCADELGFSSQAVRIDRKGFLSKYTLPAIADIITKEGMSHFVLSAMLLSEHYVSADKLYHKAEKIDGDVEVRNVTFRYGKRKPVLNNVSFTIPKGKKGCTCRHEWERKIYFGKTWAKVL